MSHLELAEAGPDDAAEVLAVITAAFGARPALEPPSTALTETVSSVAATLAGPGGLLVRRDGRGVGALLFDTSRAGMLGLRRVSVDPSQQGHGVASAMVGVAEDVAETRGLDGVWLTARRELPDNIVFWTRRGYLEIDRTGPLLILAKALWVAVPAPTAAATQALGQRLASLTRPGDLLVITGGLGAGKTTLTQGIGSGLGVRGPVTSPTFVIARVHPPTTGGPSLVHVDAYRLGGIAELDDLDLDASVEDSVTVVEWGRGLAEGLADARLDVSLDLLAEGGAANLAAAGPHRGRPPAGVGQDAAERSAGPSAAPDDRELRVVSVRPRGARWATTPLRSTLLT
jgi:tRNA threonylcarbamoyladenosine biosynthesis protein TsaE